MSTKPILWCDNTSDIALDVNPMLHYKTKHMDLDYDFISDKVLANEITV